MTLTVGLTFDLRDEYRRLGYSAEDAAEFDSIETIDAIDDSLTALGCRTDRIGSIRQLTNRLAAGNWWDLVFNIAEGLRGFGRESQVPALLDAYDIPYTFSDPLTLSLTLHKGMAKRVARDLGVLTPEFAVVELPADLPAVDLPFPVFVKPVAAGTSMGVDAGSKVHDADALKRRCIHLLERFDQPVLIEGYLPGREMTVGIVGTGREARALGAMEVLLQPAAEQDVYSYDNKAHYLDRVRYRVADDDVAAEACEVALRVWRGFGCRDGGRVDVRCDKEGRVNFLEVNPLAGLHPIHADLVLLCGMIGVSYRQLIADILSSACQRGSRMTDAALPTAFVARGV
jgi:D-alanine-D-alanine ligase